MTIDIPEDIALRLKALAKQNDADVNDLLRDMLARYANDSENNEKKWATLADMARHAKELNMSSPEPLDTAGRDDKVKRRATTADFARIALAADLSSPHPVDTSERSREILNTEFADYLKRRVNR